MRQALNRWTRRSLFKAFCSALFFAVLLGTTALFIQPVTVTEGSGSFNLSGTIYSDTGTTVFDCSATNLTIKVSINGAAVTSTTCTTSAGTYSFVGLTAPSAGQPIAVFISSTNTQQATRVTRYNTGDISGFDLYQNYLIVGHLDSGPITNSDLTTARTTADTGIRYTTSSGNLTVNTNIGLYVTAGKTFSPGGTVTTQGTGNTGHLVIATGATLNMAGNNLSVRGSFTNSGTYTPGSNTTTLTGTATTLTITSGGTVFNNLTLNGSSGIYTVNDAASVSGDLTITAGTLSGTNNVTVNGNVAGPGTISLTGGLFEQRVAASKNFGTGSGTNNWSFNDLKFSNSTSSGITITTTAGTGTETVKGTLTLGGGSDSAGGTTTLDAGSRSWTLSGTTGTPFVLNSSPAASFTASSSTFSYTGDNGSGNTTAASVTYNNLILSKATETFVMGGDITTGNLTVTNGTFSTSGNLTITGTLTVTGTLNGTANVTLNGSTTGIGTVTLTGGTFEQRISVDSTFGGSSGSNTWAFNNLTFDNSDTTDHAITMGAATGGITISGVLKVGGNSDTNITTVAAGSRTWTLSGTTGTPINMTSHGAITVGTSTFTFTGDNGSGNTTIPSISFYNLTLNKSTETFVNAGNITVNNILTISSGTFTTTSSTLLSIGVQVVVGSTGLLNGTGNVTCNGQVGPGAGQITMTGGTFEIRVAVAATLGSTNTTTYTFFNLILSNSDSVSHTITANTATNYVVSNTFQVGKTGDSAVVLNAGSRFWTLSGTTGSPLSVVSPASITFSTSTFTFSGDNASGNTTIPVLSYNNLTINGSTETYVMAGGFTVGGNLALTNGTFSNGGFNLIIAGSISGSTGTLSGTGNVTLNGGTNGNFALNLTAGTFEERVGADTTVGISSGTNTWNVNNLTFSNSDGSSGHTITQSGNSLTINVAGVMQIGKSSDAQATTFIANRTFVLNGTNGTPLQITTSPAATLTTSSSSSFTFAGNNPSGDTIIPAINYGGLLAVNNSSETYDMAGPTTVGHLTPLAGMLASAYDMTVTIQANGSSGGDLNFTGGTFTYCSSIDHTFGGASGDTWTFNNISFCNPDGSSAHSITVTPGSNVVNGIMQVGMPGDVNSFSIAGGNWTFNGTSGTPLRLLSSPAASFTTSPNATFAGNNLSGNTTIPAINYANLTFNNSSETYVLSGSTTVSNALTIAAGTLDVDASQNYPLSVGGNWLNQGIFLARNGTVTLTPLISGLTLTTGGSAFYNLIMNGGGTATSFIEQDALTVSNNLTLTMGGLDTNSTGNYSLTIGGSLSEVAGSGSLSTNGSTVTFNATSTGKTIGSGFVFYNLVFNGNGGGWTLSDTTVKGNLTLTQGTVTTTGSTITLAGTTTQTLSGGFTGSSAFNNLTITNTSGSNANGNELTSFVPGVIFAGDTAINGVYTITTPSVRVQYTSGSTLTVNTVNWNGQSTSTPIYFRNSATSGTWKLKITGTQTSVSNLNVSRSNASSGNAVKAATGNNVSGGNNANWSFFVPADPTSLAQTTTAGGVVLQVAQATNTTGITFGATVAEADTSPTLQLCIEVEPTSTDFTGAATCTSATTLSGTSLATTLNQVLAPNVAYHWRARTVDSAGYTSAWVTFAVGTDFVIDTIAPTAPGIPSTDTPTLETTPTWVWAASTDALSGLATNAYVVQWSTDSNFFTILGSATTNTPTYVHLLALIPGDYYFRVNATDQAGNISDWSPVGLLSVVVLPTTKSPLPPSETPTTSTTTTSSSPSPTISPTPGTETAPTPVPVPLLFRSGPQSLGVMGLYSFTTTPFLRSYLDLAAAFPNLAATLESDGITRPGQLGKLRNAPITLPATSNLKKLPTDIVFVRTGSSLTLATSLTVDANDNPILRAPLLSGAAATLYVRPDQPVTDITATILLGDGTSTTQAAVATLHFTDPDGDGVYSASLDTPAISGNYSIQVTYTYANATALNKSLQTVMVVDPDGYIYETLRGNQVRVPNATVTLSQLNTATNKYEVWSASKLGQVNPQITSSDGQYAFLVPAGTYEITVHAQGYKNYQSNPIKVINGGNIHLNIELKPWFPDWLYWVLGGLLALGTEAYLFVRARKKRTMPI